MGGVYITDSINPRIWHYSKGNFKVLIEDVRFTANKDKGFGLGLSGIVRMPDGSLIVAVFATGKIFRVTTWPIIKATEIKTDRSLFNPDGLLVLDQQTVLLCEGDIQGRTSQLVSLKISPNSNTAKVKTLIPDIESAVNLTWQENRVLVTDARIRKLLKKEQAKPENYSRLWMLNIEQKPIIAEGFESPESIAQGKDSYFVSNIGQKLEPLTQDADGRIDILDTAGFVASRDIFPSTDLHAPKGLAVVGNNLWIADIDRLVGCNINTRSCKQVIDLKPFGVRFANDVAKETNTTLLVSATHQGALYRVNIVSHEITLLATDITGANGIFVEGNKAIIVGLGNNTKKGKIFAIDLKTATKEILVTNRGHFDGVARDKKKQLILSDWSSLEKPVLGRLVYANKNRPLRYSSQLELFGPADFVINDTFDKIILPVTINNQVVVFPL